MKEEEITITSSVNYSTPNSALAAYLFCQGYDYLGADHSDPQNVVFQFANSSKTLAKTVSNWQIGKAPGDCYQFYLAYRRFVWEAKNQ